MTLRAVIRVRRLAPSGCLVAILCLFAGCGFSSDDGSFAPGNDCAESEDCAQGVCDAGFCVAMSTAPVRVVIEVLRSPSDANLATPASWLFQPNVFSGSTTEDLMLPGTRTVEGNVRWKGERVPATVRFIRHLDDQQAAVAPVVVEVDTGSVSATVVDGGSGGFDYNTKLVVGQTYDVVVLPGNDALDNEAGAPAIRTLPPIYGTLEIPGVVTAEPIPLDFEFPAALDDECAAGQFVGCLLTGRMLSFDGELPSPASGLQVRAVERDTGRLLSSIAETDPDGNYAIRVPAEAGSYFIRVTSSAGSVDPFPSISLDPDVVFEEDPVGRTVFLPRIETVNFSGSVQDSDSRLVPGATVRFESRGIFDDTALGLQGEFRASATTGTDGRYSLGLLPGAYDAVVTPPDDSEDAWAPTAAEVVVLEGLPDPGSEEPITLESQTVLSGTCTTFAGNVASGVTVAARARTAIGGLQRSRETVSAESGEYELKVDGGLYDLFIKVSESTGFPWLVEPQVLVDPADGPEQRDWELPPPIVVRGTVTTFIGTEMGGAPIRAYVLIEDEGALVSGRPLRALQVAETTSAEDGTYQLLIAPTVGELSAATP